jgi:type I restriction enzyme S subunit
MMHSRVEFKRLGDLAFFEMGQSPDSATVNDDGLGTPFLQGCAEFGEMHPSNRLYCTRPNKSSRPGDILISVRAPVGDLNIADKAYCIGRGLAAIRFHSLDQRFGWHALIHCAPTLKRVSQGSTFEAIGRTELHNLHIPVVSPSEQRRIAAILDTLDAAIQATEALIAKLHQAKVGLLHDLLTRGIDEHGRLRDPDAHPEQFKDSPLGRIPREWAIVTLGEVTESAVDGPFGSNLKTEHYVNEPGVRVVRLQNVGVGEFDGSDEAYINEDHALSLARHAVLPGDLIVASLGDENHPIARACLYPDYLEPGIVKADCFRFRMSSHRAVNTYVMHMLNCPSTRGDITLYSQGVTRDRANLGSLKRFRLRLPTVKEQRRIVDALTSMDDRISTETATRNTLMASKQGLMPDLLAGRVRVSAAEELVSA